MSFSTDQPGKIILEDPHEDDDDEAQQQHHQHQRVNDGQPVDLQGFGEERVVPEALASTGMRKRGLEPAYTVGVGDCKAASSSPLLKGNRLDVLYRNVGEDHGFAVILDIKV